MTLSIDQIISNVANVIYMAKIDRKITTSESKAIEEIVKNYGAKKSDFNKANKLADTKDFQINLNGNYSDKVKNLEEIIYVALIDGNLEQYEKTKILEAARDIFISETQLNIIISEVNNIIESTIVDKKCNNCNSLISDDAKYCPQCGCPVSDSLNASSIALTYEIPHNGIAIEFAESTAASFADAVMEQQKAPINKTCKKGKKTWYLAAWPDISVIEAMNLAGNLKGLRNRKIYINGETQKWDEVFGFSYCADQRSMAYNPTKYCFGLDENRFNIWGCTQSRMDWNEWSNWFSFGVFEKTGILRNQITFKFNKEKIEHELRNNLFRCKYCLYKI